jgi:UTP--glucose-1-phosphate uridylyltransferase
VLLVDDIIASKTPAIKQLLEVFDDFDKQIIGVKEVPEMDVDKYEIIDSSVKCDDLYLVTDLIENPSPRIAPSNIAVMGRYILKPSIFPILRKAHKVEGSEYQLTDALTEISRVEGLLALELEGNDITLEYH